jgi:putative tryptophan/tyrosine transport system substrate-binding protein
MPGNNYPQNRTRKGWTILAGVIVISLLLSGCAQRPKVYRVGIVSGADSFASIADGFKAKMTELGYAEGKNITYDLQKVNVDPAGEQRVVKKFVDDKVDLIFAFPSGAAIAAKVATQGTNIPVVFANVTIEGNNIVESVRQPGGNITGVRFPGPDLTVKRFEFLMQLAPRTKRLWITYDTNYATTKSALEALRPAVAAAGVTLVEAPVTNVEGIQADLQARAKSADIGMDAILIMPEILSQSQAGWAVISKFAADHQVPIAGSPASEADQGAVFSYIPDSLEFGKLAAPLADKVLKGTKAGTIPVVSPEARLRLNYKRAQELGLAVPEGLLKQATEIIR